MVLVLAQSLQASSKIAQTDRSRRLCRRDHGWHALIHFGQQQLQSWQSANEWMGLDCHSQEALCESQLASARKLHLPMKSSQRGLHPSSSKSMSAAGRLAALERLSCSTYVFSRSSSSGPWKWHCISTPALHSFAAAPYKAQLLVHDVAETHERRILPEGRLCRLVGFGGHERSAIAALQTCWLHHRAQGVPSNPPIALQPVKASSSDSERRSTP
ncbi:unnamed protein product [Durusdinium trenchii]|uniref:Uncharacterized protein n=1 Tax=Durusdinium trenchii TaxID=1381693 RepID=A0ABP0PK04_9DINO